MKRITEKDLIDWAAHGEAEGDLPILIRRLVHSTVESPNKVEFPGGDSIVSSPGFDGVVVTDKHNEWVPAGESNWELSRRKKFKQKADEDYQQRTDETPAKKRRAATFVFVTPHRWRDKDKWEQKKCAERKWKKVRALDAVNLEQWIETSTSVQVWMAEKLERTFPGCFNCEQEWEKWATVTKPQLSSNLVLAERQDAVNNLTEWLSKPPCSPFRVIADSCGEAVAFACAALAGREEHADKLIVVKDNQDEAYKLLNDENSAQPVFLFAEESDAVLALSRKAHIIIAEAKGGRRENGDQPGLLRRISQESFIQAVIDMGCERKEAEKWNRESGRSVSILRRRLAPQDSTIARPDWAKGENVQPMIAAALAGAWDENSEFDRKFVSHLAGTDYKSFEAQVNNFRRLDDAPVEKIGGIWIIKSRIDALLGVAESITSGSIQSFWENVEKLLTIRDPELDIPDNERMFTSIHGKAPPYSEALFSAATDTLILLSVYHAQITAYDNIGESVEIVVRKVLQNAESDRWRSLCNLLPKLAEAAPNAFMSALEEDLRNKKPSISSLFSSDSEWPSPTFRPHRVTLGVGNFGLG